MLKPYCHVKVLKFLITIWPYTWGPHCSQKFAKKSLYFVILNLFEQIYDTILKPQYMKVCIKFTVNFMQYIVTYDNKDWNKIYILININTPMKLRPHVLRKWAANRNTWGAASVFAQLLRKTDHLRSWLHNWNKYLRWNSFFNFYVCLTYIFTHFKN